MVAGLSSGSASTLPRCDRCTATHRPSQLSHTRAPVKIGHRGGAISLANRREALGVRAKATRTQKVHKKRQRKGVHAQLAAAKRAGANGLQQGLAKVRRFVGVGGDDVAAKIGAMRSEASAFWQRVEKQTGSSAGMFVF